MQHAFKEFLSKMVETREAVQGMEMSTSFETRPTWF